MLELIAQSRKRNETLCINAVRTLVSLVNYSEAAFDYVIGMPSPSYLYSSFFDMMNIFARAFLKDAEKYPEWNPQRLVLARQTI